jgi:hypothetical protein
MVKDNDRGNSPRQEEAARRITMTMRMELRKLWAKERNKSKHDRLIRIEQTYRMFEKNLDLVVKDQGLQAWELAVRTHWA